MNTLILQTLRDFSLDLYEPIIPRELDLGEPLAPKAGNLVKVVSGMRRSGKSYRLLQEMKRLCDRGIPMSRLCYFNFEDNRLMPVTAQTGDEVLEAFTLLNPRALEEGAYLFFDEIQEMEGWGSWLRRVVDTTRATIYVSGSSSKMLSSEIASEFRGRALDFEQLPFSFREYASFRLSGEVDVHAMSFSTAEQALLQAAFSDYMREGGFPATFGLPRAQAVALLQSYAQRVVARDVVERHDVSKPRVASLFAQRLLGLNGRQLSIRKAANDFKSMGIVTSREMLGDLLGFFQDAYLVFQVKERSFSLSERTTAMPKVYAIDPGLAVANARANVLDEGQALEDVVYLELRRRSAGLRREGIASLRTQGRGYEIDFAVGDLLDPCPVELYQVSARMNDDATFKREVRALEEALLELGLSRGTLIVGDGAATEWATQSGAVIEQVPAWRWLLGSAG